VLLALVGVATLGWGVAVVSWTPSLIGTGLLLVGAAISLRGGILSDAVPGLAIRRELGQVIGGEVHHGVAPGDMLTSPAVRRDAIATNRSTRARETAAGRRADVRWAPVAGWLLLLVATVLTVSQWELVAPTVTGRVNGVRDTAIAIVLGLGGMRVALSPGRHLVASGTCGVAGTALALVGLMAEHDHQGLAVVQVSSGCLAVLCALTAAMSPARDA
jgi:hypothetical protein